MARPDIAPRTAAEEPLYIEPREAPIERATDLGSVQVLKHANLYLLTDPFGDIHVDSRGLGLYEQDTRLLSCSVLRVGGDRPVLLQGSVGANYHGVIQLTNPSMDRNPDDKIHPQEALVGRTLGISRERILTGDGLRERVSVVNYAETAESVTVDLAFGSDSADIFEVRGYPRPVRGTLLPIAAERRQITFRYDGRDAVRRFTHLAFSEPADHVGAPSELERHIDLGASVSLRWNWALGPGEQRSLDWTVWGTREPIRGSDDRRAVLFPEPPAVEADLGLAAYRAWQRGTTEIHTDHELFNLTVTRSVADLRLLLNDGPGPEERYMAAGVPWFSTLFGRDAIISALQALAFRPQLAVETLAVLADRQATAIDARRDAEPGKILHELRVGEMAAAGELPHTPYYGSVDATPLWLVLLGATYDWIGDASLIERFWPNAMAAMDWIDRYGDRDGDGFVEYLRQTDDGLVNQGWKDSHDSIRDRGGREVEPPIALCEVQGYVYDAKRRMAKLATVMGDAALSTRLTEDADRLQHRFQEAFWVPDQRFYALALDGSKRRADAITSNPGHCLWSGIVASEHAADVAERLMSPALFSGWGIRTYAAGQPGYNPIGYHTGSVWPHDTSLVVAGLKRYGFDGEADRLIGHVFEAAQHFADFRLPELFCGFDRDHSAMPVPYPVACSPQAWAAGASFMFLETMLGLRAHADRKELELWHPRLPDWLGKVTVSNLRVGDAAVDLLFHRWRGTTSAEVLRKVGDIDVTIRL
ncbi:MAG: glycogen debranching N-terminal domain-containing protein [Chloroflexota bacterium]